MQDTYKDQPRYIDYLCLHDDIDNIWIEIPLVIMSITLILYCYCLLNDARFKL